MTKQTIAVIFGGKSAEHDVSIITALVAIIKPLQVTGKYNVVPVYITKSGDWYSHEKLADVVLYQSGGLDAFLAKQKRVQMTFKDGLQFIGGGLKTKVQQIDIVFPSMHGTYGEDGSLMGLLRMANVPFVGCDMASSAAAMDKVTTKLLAEAHGLHSTKMIFRTKHEFAANPGDFQDAVDASLQYPVFVKPAHLGSSIGITKVVDKKDLLNALEVAFHYDTKVLVEEGVADLTEVTVPVLGNHDPEVALVEESILSEDGVFDFDTKYLRGGKKGGKKMAAQSDGATQGAQGYSHLPARLDKKMYKQAEAAALATYKALDCTGMARVDLLIDNKTSIVYVNEVNTLPGSLYAHNWRAAGYSNVELVEKLIALAIERFAEQQKQSVTFATNFLQQF